MLFKLSEVMLLTEAFRQKCKTEVEIIKYVT